MFKIDSIKLQLIGNYLNDLDPSRLTNVTRYDKKLFSKLDNLRLSLNEYSLTIEGSVSKFMGVDINHSNIDLFINRLSDVLNIRDLAHAKILRFDICTDLQTDQNIDQISLTHGKLTRFHRTKQTKHNTIYYNTSKHKHKGTTLKLYQKAPNVIRYEMTVFKNSKYCIKRLNLVKKHFVQICEVATDYYLKIKKMNKQKMINIDTNKDILTVSIRLIYNKLGQNAINDLLDLCKNKSRAYKHKRLILDCLTQNDSTNDIELLIETSLNNTKKLRYD